MKSFNKVIFAFLAILMMCCTMGCASLRHAGYKQDYITNQIENYAYHSQDYSRVWAEARALLFEKGFQVRDSGNGYNVETEWGWTDNDERRRYLVNGFDTPNGFTVQFKYIREVINPGANPYTEAKRDYLMEYELLKRLNYGEWSNIDAAAENYADQRVASEK